jgi:hypothetical protein
MTEYKSGRYICKTREYTFELDIYNSENIYSIEFGDLDNREDGSCIYFKYDGTKSIMKLESLQHQSTCTTNTSMPRGNATRLMLKVALATCIKMFPNVQRIIFNDAASIDCHGKNMNLCYKYVLEHGMSWYEHLSAKLVNKVERDLLKAFKVKLLTRPTSGHFSFFKLNSHAFDTWHDYFKTIDLEDCAFFILNKREFRDFAKIELFYADWYFSASIIKQYNVEIIDFRRKKVQPITQFQFGGCRQAHVL